MTVCFHKYIPADLFVAPLKLICMSVFSASASLVNIMFHVFWEMLVVWKQREEVEEEKMAKAKAILHVLLRPQVTRRPHS